MVKTKHKTTGKGFHEWGFVKYNAVVLVAHLGATLCKLHGLYIAYQAPLSMEFSRQEY